jgi:hypothetical protein
LWAFQERSPESPLLERPQPDLREVLSQAAWIRAKARKIGLGAREKIEKEKAHE